MKIDDLTTFDEVLSRICDNQTTLEAANQKVVEFLNIAQDYIDFGDAKAVEDLFKSQFNLDPKKYLPVIFSHFNPNFREKEKKV